MAKHSINAVTVCCMNQEGGPKLFHNVHWISLMFIDKLYCTGRLIMHANRHVLLYSHIAAVNHNASTLISGLCDRCYS